jgi:hypothetical protein
MEQAAMTVMAERTRKIHWPKYLRWDDNEEQLPRQIVRRSVRKGIADAESGGEIGNIGFV